MYFRTCPYCGDDLDPGERCECRNEKEQRDRFFESILSEDLDGQLSIQSDAEQDKHKECYCMAG